MNHLEKNRFCLRLIFSAFQPKPNVAASHVFFGFKDPESMRLTNFDKKKKSAA